MNIILCFFHIFIHNLRSCNHQILYYSLKWRKIYTRKCLFNFFNILYTISHDTINFWTIFIGELNKFHTSKKKTFPSTRTTLHSGNGTNNTMQWENKLSSHPLMKRVRDFLREGESRSGQYVSQLWRRSHKKREGWLNCFFFPMWLQNKNNKRKVHSLPVFNIK